MRRHLIVIVSLGLNVVLAAVMLSGRRNLPATTGTAGLQAAGANRIRTETVVRKQFFSWQQVESQDYPAYIKNLRDIGCPEQTVRDIIIADVNQLYAKKRLEVDMPDQQWWRSEADSNVVQAAATKLQGIEQERRTLLTTLLGTNWDTTYPSSIKTVVALNGPVLGEMAPVTKDAVQEIIGKSQQRVRAYLDAQQKDGKPADPAELARLNKQTRAELAQVLNPAQLEEFLLRYSQTASNLRNQLKGFDVTAEEFRAIFRAQDPLDQQMGQLTGDAAAMASQRTALEKQEADAVKNVLGEKRYEEYRLSQDPAYRDAVKVGQETGATAAVVQRLYELNKTVRDEQDRIRNDASLTPEQKNEQLAKLEQQQQTVGDEILGLTPASAPPAPPPPVPLAVHAYSPGETVDQIAARYGVSSVAILNANPNVNFNQLAKGTGIRIPKPQQ